MVVFCFLQKPNNFQELEDATTYQSKWNAEEEGHPHDLLSWFAWWHPVAKPGPLCWLGVADFHLSLVLLLLPFLQLTPELLLLLLLLLHLHMPKKDYTAVISSGKNFSTSILPAPKPPHWPNPWSQSFKGNIPKEDSLPVVFTPCGVYQKQCS